MRSIQKRVAVLGLVSLSIGIFALSGRQWGVESSPGTAIALQRAQSAGPERSTAVSYTEGHPPAASTAEQEPLLREAAAIRAAVLRYSEGRFNAFIDEESVLPELTRTSKRWAVMLSDWLGDTSELEALPADIQFQRNRPKAILERMSMIDLLTQAARTDPQARQALVAAVEAPISPELPVHVKRALVGERYDILFRLAQFDTKSAVSLFSSFPAAAQDVLRPALLSGLAEGGISQDEAVRLVGDIPPPQSSR